LERSLAISLRCSECSAHHGVPYDRMSKLSIYQVAPFPLRENSSSNSAPSLPRRCVVADAERHLPDRLARRERTVPLPDPDNVDALAAALPDWCAQRRPDTPCHTCRCTVWWTAESGCVEQATHIRRQCHQRPSWLVALSTVVASVPSRCVIIRCSLLTTAVCTAIGRRFHEKSQPITMKITPHHSLTSRPIGEGWRRVATGRWYCKSN
jgi:hypothetical protein